MLHQLASLSALRMALRSRLPGRRFSDRPTGGSGSARYCYGVWLRHFVLACRGSCSPFPLAVGELGPGDSLGIGLAALLSGAERYVAFDVVRHADPAHNLAVLTELIDMFRARAAIPDASELPDVKPPLPDYAFPTDLLTEARLAASLSAGRLDAIRAAVAAPDGGSMIRYVAPWLDRIPGEPGSLDLVLSQAVMEHVDALPQAYATVFRWLRPGGLTSHQIDFKCHGTARDWNGHWTYSDLVWGLVRGNQPYLINRQAHSRHTDLITQAGFRILCNSAVRMPSRLRRPDLARRFAHLTDDDLQTGGAFIQATRSAEHAGATRAGGPL